MNMARMDYSEAAESNDPRTELVILGLSENAAVTNLRPGPAGSTLRVFAHPIEDFIFGVSLVFEPPPHRRHWNL
jgi:hypothetical protein